MKKLNVLFLLLLVIPAVFAQEPAIDYSSPSQVNSLEPLDLASAIEQGKITDMSIVDDNKLAAALGNRPSISAKLEDNRDLARAVNQELSLLDNPSVMDDVDSRAKSDVFILNDNPDIKKEWFAQKGITDEGAGLESYDGSIVKTRGSHATTFNANEHPGARVARDGRLILADGAEIASAEVTKAEDGSINVNGGHADLSNSRGTSVHVNRGTAQIGDKIYTSADNTLDISIKDGNTIITGTNVVEARNGVTTATFSGEVAEFADGHKTFAKGTEYTFYLDGKISKTYAVGGLTEYRPTGTPGCDGSKSCIQDVGGNAKVVSKNGNAIGIKAFDDSIKYLKIDEITDGSSVVLYDNGVKITFTKGPFTVEGDLNERKTEGIETSYTDENGVPREQKITSSSAGETSIFHCSQCESKGHVYGNGIEKFQKELEKRGAKLGPGTEFVFAYKKDDMEVYRTNDKGEFFIWDPTNLIFYKPPGDDPGTYRLENGKMIPVSDTEIGPRMAAIIRDESLYGRLGGELGGFPPGSTLISPAIDSSIAKQKYQIGQSVELGQPDFNKKTIPLNGQTAKIIARLRCPGCYDVKMPNGDILEVRGNVKMSSDGSLKIVPTIKKITPPSK